MYGVHRVDHRRDVFGQPLSGRSHAGKRSIHPVRTGGYLRHGDDERESRSAAQMPRIPTRDSHSGADLCHTRTTDRKGGAAGDLIRHRRRNGTAAGGRGRCARAGRMVRLCCYPPFRNRRYPAYCRHADSASDRHRDGHLLPGR